MGRAPVVLILLSVCLFFFLNSESFSASAREIPEELQTFLLKEIQLDPKEVNQVRSGQSVAKVLDTDNREEVAVFGLVYIDTTQEYFLKYVRDSLQFESVRASIQAGLFSTPPQLSDVSELTWENDDIEKIRNCDPFDCTARFPGGSVFLFHKQVNWTLKNAIQQANHLMRRLSVEYVAKYQEAGDDALTSYYKDGKFWSVKEGTRKLLTNSPYLHTRAPELVSYLRNYPHEKNQKAEDIFYWQKGDFGLQPVIRFNHVVILPVRNSSQVSYMIGSKMLFANHYFRDALELRSLVPDQGRAQGFYFVVVNRSHVDGMTGFKGLFIRSRATKKSMEHLKSWLSKTKERAELGFQTKGK